MSSKGSGGGALGPKLVSQRPIRVVRPPDPPKPLKDDEPRRKKKRRR